MRAANVNSMRGVTNNAGVVSSNQRAEGTVSADVMPSSTNQGGGIRPSVRPANVLSDCATSYSFPCLAMLEKGSPIVVCQLSKEYGKHATGVSTPPGLVLPSLIPLSANVL